MSLYDDLDEAQLEIEIAALKAKIRAAASAPSVRSIAGEGRRVEFFAGGGEGGSIADLRRMLADAERALGLLRGYGGSAIGVRFP